MLGSLSTTALADSPDEPGTRRALILCGLPGDDEHQALFAKTAESIAKALIDKYGFNESAVLVRFGVEARLQLPRSRGLSNIEGIEADVAELKSKLRPEDTLWVIVIGHGHFDGKHSHFNIPGPDLDERGFGKLFQGLNAREQVFFITTPASGFFLKPLAAPGRVVITATEPDREVNETLFPLALAEGLENPPEGIDRDKNGEISIFELYLAVVADVMKRYVDDENLPTEHARIDDNGDGHGSELQEAYLPPELGGRAEAESETAKPRDSKLKQQPAKIGPKDEGALASRLRLGPVNPPKP
jgi:hypothetical protein